LILLVNLVSKILNLQFR